MARPHKQMPGKAYHVIYHDNRSATVECVYYCPYCRQDVKTSFEVAPDFTDQLEQGVFFEPVRCTHCEKVTDVRFWGSTRI